MSVIYEMTAPKRWWCMACKWTGLRYQCSTRRGLIECPHCLPRGICGVILPLRPNETVAEAQKRWLDAE